MASSPSNATYAFASGGVLPGYTPTANQIAYWNVGAGSTSITWTPTGTNIASSAFALMTGMPYSSFKPPKRKRGWNGASQPRCADCMRWAKRKDALTVECKHCMGEMPAW